MRARVRAATFRLPPGLLRPPGADRAAVSASPPQVPFYAATLARARLQKAQERLAECLRDPVLRADAWPAPRALLLLKLFATVFPASGAAACAARGGCPHVCPGLRVLCGGRGACMCGAGVQPGGGHGHAPLAPL